MMAALRRLVQLSALVSVGSGFAAGLVDEWDLGTYCLVSGALGLWAVDRWDDIWGLS